MMVKSKQAANGHLTIAAGPVYVEFRTDETAPPASNVHTVLRPHGQVWEPSIGGSVWKMARYFAKSNQSGDMFVLVSRFAKERTSNPQVERKPDRPFFDDAHWLKQSMRDSIQQLMSGNTHSDLTRIVTERVIVCFRNSSENALTDYTFHMEHPTWQPWPILTISGGAASELEWRDVVDEWHKNWKHRQNEYNSVIVILTGVLRTRLLETLAHDIEVGSPKTVGKDGILNHAKLVIDFGRTPRIALARSDPKSEARKEVEKFCEQVQACVREADVVLADEHTAAQFDLRQFENLPKHRLVLRRTMAKDEIWWLYKKGVPGEVLRGYLRSLEADASKVTENHRPARDFILAKSLCRGGKNYNPTWVRYFDSSSPQSIDDITLWPDFRKQLIELQDLIQHSAISTLFIYGESGTGKEIVSRWIHRVHPAFSSGKFHAVSCGRQRGALVQSELFGHVKGAFNEAFRDRDGAFVAADGGVLLLDDLDSLDESTQAMLLRVVESGMVLPVGADIERPVSLFLIATTNVHPEKLIRRRKDKLSDENRPALREDLYFRFRRFGETLFLPALRERRDDVLPTAYRLWEEHNQQHGLDLKFPKKLKGALTGSDICGNFRTLIAAVAKTFRRALALHYESATAETDDMALPEVVESWLSKRADDQMPLEADEQRGSQLLNWLIDNQYHSKLLAIDPKDRKRVEEFVKLWRQAWNSVEPNLTLTQIAECCGVPKGTTLIKRLKDAGAASGKGQNAKWTIPES